MAEKGFFLEVITIEKVAFKGNVDLLHVRGFEGEIGILPNHAPLFALLVPGETMIRSKGKDIHLATGEGFVIVSNNRASILVTFASKSEEINIGLAEIEKSNLEKQLQSRDVEEWKLRRIKENLSRINAELMVAKKYQ